MRFSPSPRWAVLGLLATLTAPSALAQFSPQGRSRKPPPKAAPSAAATPRDKALAAPSGAVAAPAPNPVAARATESAAELVARYQSVAFEQPTELAAIERLARAVTSRDGGLDPYLKELAAMADATGPRSRPARLVQAGLLERSGRNEAALQALAQALSRQPRDADALLMKARILEVTGDKQGARDARELALAEQKGAAYESTLRALRKDSLDLADLEGARRYQTLLTAASPGRAYVAGELGRELLERGQRDAAIEELREVTTRFRGPAAGLAPLLRELGRAELASGDGERAEQTLENAARAARGQPGLMAEIDVARLEVAEQRGHLNQLLLAWSREPESSARLRATARAREKLGDPSGAITTLRRAVSRAPSDIDVHLELLRLLQNDGRLDEAEREYAAIARLLPDDVPQAVRYMDALMGRGKRSLALMEFTRIERAARNSEDLLTLVDYAERIEEPALAAQLVARLEHGSGGDVRQWIELGSRHFREGKIERAREIWRRIPAWADQQGPEERSRTYLIYGQLLLDHDDPAGGLAALEKAAGPGTPVPELQRGLALGYERAATLTNGATKNELGKRAVALWLMLLATPTRSGSDEAAHAEARRHVIRAWQRNGQLKAESAQAKARFERTPPDVEAGRLWAEAEERQGQYAQAEKIWRKILTLGPNDLEAWQALAHLQETAGHDADALDSWDHLLAVDPGRVRPELERLTRLATSLHQDSRALAYAERSVLLSPNDGESLMRLADLHRLAGQTERARAVYERAFRLDPTRSALGFALLDLQSERGDAAAAFATALELCARARDDEVVVRAVQRALGLASTGGGLDITRLNDLDLVLARLSAENPARAVFGAELLRVYEAERQAYTTANRGVELERLGRRALTAALSAMASPRVDDQRIALGLLAHAPPRETERALLDYARGTATEGLRVRALDLLSRGGDADLVTPLAELLDGRSGLSGRVNQAAARTLAGLGTSAAEAPLERALGHRDPVVRAYAAMGLARLWSTHRRPPKSATREVLERALREPAESASFRAAAALALGGTKASENLLEEGEGDAEPLVAAAALRAHAEQGVVTHTLERALASALLAADDFTRQAAAQSAVRLCHGGTPLAWGASLDSSEIGSVETLDPASDLRAQLIGDVSNLERAQARLALDAPLRAAALELLESPGARQRAVLTRVAQSVAKTGRPLWSSLDASTPSGDASLDSRLAAAERALAMALAPALLSLVRDEDTSRAALALSFLPSIDDADDRVRTVYRDALFGDVEVMREAALEKLAREGRPGDVVLLAELGQKSPAWAVRRRVAVLLVGFLGRPLGATERAAVEAALTRMSHDENPLVARAARTVPAQ